MDVYTPPPPNYVTGGGVVVGGGEGGWLLESGCPVRLSFKFRLGKAVQQRLARFSVQNGKLQKIIERF